MEITIVTADGNHVIANPYCNSDLFWALRGGGGGTWGVVTSVTYKTHPSTPYAGGFLALNSTNADSTKNFLTELIRLTPSLVTQGYGGYSGGDVHTYQLFMFSPNVTEEQNEAAFSPLFELALSQPGLTVQNVTTVFPDWWSWYNAISPNNGQVGVPTEISSWLLPKDVVDTDRPDLLAGELLKTSGFGYL